MTKIVYKKQNKPTISRKKEKLKIRIEINSFETQYYREN